MKSMTKGIEGKPGRRKFMALGTAAITSLGFPLIVRAAPSSDDSSRDIGFSSTLHTECAVYDEVQLIANLHLVNIENCIAQDTLTRQFILDFDTPEAIFLPEASYRVVLPDMGMQPLFIQPSGSLTGDEHDGTRFHACLTLLV